VQGLPDQGHAWLVVAMASTLAGNLTLVGSIANFVVTERARTAGSNYRYGHIAVPGFP